MGPTADLKTRGLGVGLGGCWGRNRRHVRWFPYFCRLFLHCGRSLHLWVLSPAVAPEDRIDGALSREGEFHGADSIGMQPGLALSYEALRELLHLAGDDADLAGYLYRGGGGRPTCEHLLHGTLICNHESERFLAQFLRAGTRTRLDLG